MKSTLSLAAIVTAHLCGLRSACSQLQPSAPVVVRSMLGPTSVNGLAYDEERRVGVCYGWRSSETWNWNGVRWIERVTRHSPPQRMMTGMAWDPEGGGALLFGGALLLWSNYFQDTWRWDGDDWTQVAASGPSARVAHSMATDPKRRRVVLFGGLDVIGATLDDTWEWDGRAWTQIIPTSGMPPGRNSALMAWNSKTQRMAMFGGGRYPFTAFSILACAEWDGRDWTNMSPIVAGGPSPALVYGNAVPDPDGKGTRIVGLWYDTSSQPRPPLPVSFLWDGVWMRWQPVGASPADQVGGIFLDPELREIVSPQSMSSASVETAAYSIDAGEWRQRTHRTIGPEVAGYFELVPWLDAYVRVSRRYGTWLLHDGGWTPVGGPVTMNGQYLDVFPLVDTVRRAVYAYSPHAQRLYRWAGNTWVLSGTQQDGVPSQFVSIDAVDPVDQVPLFSRRGEIWKWSPTITYPTLVAGAPAGNPLTGNITLDTQRNVFVLLSHNSGPSPIWEWDGSVWRSVAPPAIISGESYGAVQYMPGMGTIYATGDGIWSWNGQQWTSIPFERQFESGLILMRYDRCRHRMRIRASYSDDFWDLYPSDFAVNTTTPSPGELLKFTVSSRPHAGQPWIFLASTGTYPGIPLAGLQSEPYRVLPLSDDELLHSSLANGITGYLDSQGNGSLRLPVPNDPAMVGFHCHAVAVSIAGNQQLGLVSRPVAIDVMR